MTAPERVEFFERAVSEVIDRAAFERLLASGRRLRWKLGLDPTRPNLHLGHTLPLRKMRQGALWGHEVVLIVGDWTAQLGDPSDRDESRPVMSHEEVRRNAETYLTQFHRIVPRENVRVVMQSEWFGTFTLRDTLHLAARFTTQQMLAREDFKNRLQAARPIPIKDLLYPLLQAYDSVAIESDVEFGGTDQKFNILLGRELQEQVGQPPQQVFLVHLLPGLDGEKMSKTKPQASIWLTDPPEQMFGKVMAIRDDLMPRYFDWATEMPWDEAKRHVAALGDGSLHPRDAKEILARQIVADLHGAAAAEEAARAFRRQFVEKRLPEELPKKMIAVSNIVDVLTSTGLAKSKSEARRLIEQRGVRVNGEVVTSPSTELTEAVSTIQVGPRRALTVERSA